jgi:hypothetical protein
MEKRTEVFLGSYLYPVLVPVTIAIGMSLVSKSATGDWLRYLGSIPAGGWISVVGVMALWLFLVGTYRRIKRVRAENTRTGPFCFSIPPYGFREVSEYPYKGVLWAVRVPAPPPFHFRQHDPPSPAEIHIFTPPRCPTCKTDLEQKKTFWGKYRWSCPRPGCGFAVTNPESFSAERGRAEKIVQSDYRKHLG